MLSLHAIDQRMQHALASGDLQPIEFQAHQVSAKDMLFHVCWVPALSVKDKSKPAGFPGGPRDPNFNPFLPPAPQLTVGKLGDYHHAVLNKFPGCAHHLVLPRIEFAEQRSVLQYEDFLAWAWLLTELQGLGFYNGGEEAGASQRHLHVQWIPPAVDNASLLPFVQVLDADQDLVIQSHPCWEFRHAFIYVGLSEDAHEYARNLYQAYQLGCQKLGLQCDDQGLMPPMNILVQDGWLLIVPRVYEQIHDIPLNALSFAGMIYVREQEHIDLVKTKGVLPLLAAVTRV